MAIICTCGHNRKEHEGGSKNMSALKVQDCMIESCQCSKFHNDEKSKEIIKTFLIQQSKTPLIVILFAIAFLAIFNIYVSIELSEYVIYWLDETFEVSNNWMAYHITQGVGIIEFIIIYIWLFAIYAPAYKKAKLKLIDED